MSAGRGVQQGVSGAGDRGAGPAAEGLGDRRDAKRLCCDSLHLPMNRECSLCRAEKGGEPHFQIDFALPCTHLLGRRPCPKCSRNFLESDPARTGYALCWTDLPFSELLKQIRTWMVRNRDQLVRKRDRQHCVIVHIASQHSDHGQNFIQVRYG